jgi:hypothetical protein
MRARNHGQCTLQFTFIIQSVSVLTFSVHPPVTCPRSKPAVRNWRAVGAAQAPDESRRRCMINMNVMYKLSFLEFNKLAIVILPHSKFSEFKHPYFVMVSRVDIYCIIANCEFYHLMWLKVYSTFVFLPINPLYTIFCT